MSKILVTGGAGMIGSNLVKTLALMEHDVIVADNLWRGKISNLKIDNENYAIDIESKFHNVDLAKTGSLENLLEGVEYVYHLADIVAGIDYVFENQGDIFRQNLLINSNVISSVRKFKPKGYIYVGTACSFPAHMQYGTEAPPLKEDDQYPASPESAYGWSKLMGEYEAFLMEKEAGIPVSVLSLHNVYGTPCVIDRTSQVIPSLIKKALDWPNKEFIVWGSGTQGRAFVHVDDVISALVSTMKYGLGKGVIQIGPNKCTSIKEIAELVVKISNKEIKIVFDKSKPEGDKGRCADYSKAKELLNWEPRIGLEYGLEQMYKWIEKMYK